MRSIKKFSDILWSYSIVSVVIFPIIFILLGFFTPGYNHISQTISRLAIEKYGWLQQINFIQFGIGFITSALFFLQSTLKKQTKHVLAIIFLFCAAIAILLTLFPSDPIEDANYSLSFVTVTGLLHLGTLLGFFILAPFLVTVLKRTIQKEKSLAKLANLTASIGYSNCVFCYLWMAFYFTHSFVGFLGLFQKIIIGLCLYWLFMVLTTVRRLP